MSFTYDKHDEAIWPKATISSQNYEPTAEDKAYDGWKHFIPCRKASENPKAIPLISAGPLSFTSIHWANGYMYQAYKYGLTEADLYQTPWKDSAARNATLFEGLWRKEIDKKGVEKASVTKTIYKMVEARIIAVSIMNFILNVFALLRSAYFLRQLLELIQSPDASYEQQIVCLLLLAFCTTIRSQLMASAFSAASLAAIRARGGVLSAVFKKILNQQIQNTTIGELVNLCSNDGQRIYEAVLNAPFILSAIPAIFAAAYAVYLLGWWGIFGFAIFFAFTPIQMLLSSAVFKYRGKAIPITEERVKMMSEIVNAIKLVKMYAWEMPFARKIQKIRAMERSALKKSLLVQSVLSALPQLVPIFAAAFTFLAMTLTGYDITVTQAFVYISLLNSLRFPLGVMPYSLKALAEGVHACGRIKKVLTAEDEKMEMSKIKDDKNLVEIKNGYFGWQPQTDPARSGEEKKSMKSKAYGSMKLEINGKHSTNKPDKAELQPLVVANRNMARDDTVITLHNITLSLKRGKLLGVCGAVGSGKTCLIQAIFGMMRKRGGKISVDKRQNMAYVPQQAWIMNATVRENIIFGKPFDIKRYDTVVKACALLSDFQQLAAGDQTEVGERGINLSGGQKQRISIARAVYSDADIILLDDPLSAVDALVGQHIFTQCLKGLLFGKTILFATHQLQFLTDCDYVLVMKDGKVAEEGRHEELMRQENGEYSNLIRSFHVVENEADLDTPPLDFSANHFPVQAETKAVEAYIGEDSQLKRMRFESMTSEGSEFTDDLDFSNLRRMSNDDAAQVIAGKLTRAEGMGEDKVRLVTYISYVKAAGGCLPTLIVFFLILVYLVVQAITNYWVSAWVGAGSGGTLVNQTMLINETEVVTLVLSERIIDNPNISYYQISYVVCIAGLIVATFLNALTYVMFCLRASTKLHDQIFRKLVASPMNFFDITPSGQILNRFSKDTDEMDTALPFLTDLFFKCVSLIIGAVAIISIISPYFLLVLIPLGVIFIYLAKFCERGIQLSKRIENVTKSPLFSHIATTVQGVSTIRAYRKEEQFYIKFNHLQDRNNSALFMFDSAMRWASVRLDAVCLFLTIITFLLVTLVPSDFITPSLAALALTYAMSIGDLIQFTVRLGIESGARMISVERIQSYIESLTSEAPFVVENNRPAATWPDRGAIEFRSVDVRYRDGLPLVLKSVSLNIKSQEKIGIVGRTGSGKSSLALVLFRLMELAGGRITIDGVDISTIGLEDLRSKLSIIPQDPVLFVGTVRYNLDPFNMYSDNDLWSALKKCHISQTIRNLSGQLDALIVENGENFSVGERQLLCMARALLRHSKILVLDEATAAIDTETDSLIQNTIKEAFIDCTMLTIAHRLNTVANYDRILVLDDGKVIEFDSPAALLSQPDSVFSQMMSVQESQKQAAVQNQTQ